MRNDGEFTNEERTSRGNECYLQWMELFGSYLENGLRNEVFESVR